MSDTLPNFGPAQPQVAATLFPGGQDDLNALTNDSKSQVGQIVYNGSIIPPLDSDYLQYVPNNTLLAFTNMALSLQKGGELSYAKARSRAKALYTETLVDSSPSSKDHSLHVVASIIDDYTAMVSRQEFVEVGIGLQELTSEQLLKMVDEQAKLIKVAANDRLQIITTIFCIVTTVITVFALITTGPSAVVEGGVKKVGSSALRKFFAYMAGRIATFYSTSLGRLLLVSEVAGDVIITSQEVVNVWNEMADPSVRADRDAWLEISKLMVSSRKSERIVYRYIMKPADMIGLLAIWERGDRSALDYRLRNLVYGKSCYFSTDMQTFQKIKFRIGRVGRNVERQLGVPSLFPAFSLVLRILSRIAIKKGVPIISPLLSGGLWLSRLEQFNAQQKY